MPGELKNLVALAISSGSSKYHHHHHRHQQQQHQQEKSDDSAGVKGERAADVRRSGVGKNHVQARLSKEDSSSGAKRFTKLLSKSVGAVCSSTITASSTPLLPPSESIAKKAPVASPESEGSSLLNGGSCASPIDHAAGKAYPNFYDATHQTCDQNGDETPTHSGVTNEVGKGWSAMNGSAIRENGREREECSADEASEERWRTITRHRCSTDASRGTNTDDETMLSSVAGGVQCGNVTTSEEAGADKAPSTSALTATISAVESNERVRGWYATRKSYRSVAYKTWTVGAARKLLNSSRSDYDLPPSTAGQEASHSVSRIGHRTRTDGSVSDGEEKFYNCTYSRSQDDDLDRSLYLSTISGMHTSSSSDAAPSASGGLTLADLSKMKARKCASSDAVTLFTTGRDPSSFLSPVDSVPSTSSDQTSSLSQSANKPMGRCDATGVEDLDPVEVSPLYVSPKRPAAQVRPPDMDTLATNRSGLGLVSGLDTSKLSNGRSWLLMASSSSDDVLRDEIEGDLHSRSIIEENNNKDPVTRIKPKSGSRSMGDCFSSEDYFKFTLKKRLMQQRRQQLDLGEEHNGVDDWVSSGSPRRDTSPLLALDREIRAALHSFDDFADQTRSGSPSRHQVRPSSPTTLSSLMAAAQQRWKQQSERFTKRMERSSYCPKIENNRFLEATHGLQGANNSDPFLLPAPLRTDSRTTTTLIRIPTGQLLSSSFSSSSSTSSSTPWTSQVQPKPKQRSIGVYSPLAISVDANGVHEEEWPPNDPSNAGGYGHRPTCSLPVRNRSTTTTATSGANSPFRSSDEAMLFLKKELEVIRKKDHQILTQLKILDAEISRRKSETDALASFRPLESEELENGEYPSDEPGPLLDKSVPKTALGASHRVKAIRLIGRSSRIRADGYSNSLHDHVPPLPKCLEVSSFKTL